MASERKVREPRPRRESSVDVVIWIILSLTLVPVAGLHLVSRIVGEEASQPSTPPPASPRPGSRAG
jgi:hypothetical protein